MLEQKEVANLAWRLYNARKCGSQSITINGIKFRLDEGGYCARFVRQLHEAVLGQPEFTWEYRAATAREMEEKLKKAGLEVERPEPGDIVAFNRGGGKLGHIGIFLGKDKVAENTINASRGDPSSPGTKISSLAEIGPHRISGYYRPLAKAASQPIEIDWSKVRVVGRASGNVIDSLFVDGNIYVKISALEKEGIITVYREHAATQGKIYVE